MQDIDFITGEGTGDMLKSIYDPANKGSQFAADNEVVKISGTQEITGLKEFTLNPITPEQTFTKEPTGFESPESVIVTYNSSTRKITLTGNTNAYFRGQKITALVSGWESDAHGSTLDLPYFLYYDGSNFVWSNTVWTFDKLQIAFCFYGTNFKLVS